jgi:GNAT superfamily N-acetyltransferase
MVREIREQGKADMDGPTKTTYTLEMLHPSDLRPKTTDLPGLRIDRMIAPCPEFSMFLHTMVGYDYRWGGRTEWTKEDWYVHATRADMETWVAYVAGTPAGYFELEARPEGDVHILCFGLLPRFIGQGLGGHLLTIAVERAWVWGASRVWLRTCSHDHPHALKNYLARGFRIQEAVVEPANVPISSFWEQMTGSA